MLQGKLIAAVAAREAEAVALWRRRVERETPSGDDAAIEALAHGVAAAFEPLGLAAEFMAGGGGHHLILRGAGLSLPNRQAVEPKAGRRGGVEARHGWLLLGHLDTVYPRGTALHMPWREEAGRVLGPGVMDMKGGIALAWLALRALADLPASAAPGGTSVSPALTILLVADEETGSATSRGLTEMLARRAAAVLVLEPAAGKTGKLKTARKGIANFRLRAEGQAAHAGVDFFAGANAIVELARQAVGLAAWSDEKKGLTVNCGVIRGGTRSNVVPAEAELVVDARAWTAADLASVEQRLRALGPVDPRLRLTVTGGVNRPPMVASAASAALFDQARAAGRRVGLVGERELQECATGGGSDGNFTAALGIPTLDGMGVVGGCAHSPGEWADRASLSQRAALLALLLHEAP